MRRVVRRPNDAIIHFGRETLEITYVPSVDSVSSRFTGTLDMKQVVHSASYHSTLCSASKAIDIFFWLQRDDVDSVDHILKKEQNMFSPKHGPNGEPGEH